MPLDTSIPLQIGRAPQVQALDPMTLYNAMQERQMNALRAQALQQEMAQNALTMQNTMEDRQIAAAARAQAAAQAAEERRRLGEYRNVIGNFGVTDRAVGKRGVGYSGTGIADDPYAYVQNELVRRDFVPQAENLAKLRKEQLAGEETAAKIPGLKATSEENIVKARAAKIGQYGDAVLRASTPEEVYALIDSHADTLKELGFTADQAKKNFADLAARSGFDNAIMQSAKGAMATREHFDKMLSGQAGRSELTQDAAGNQILIDKASGIVTPVMAPASAGAPTAGAPAPVKAKLSSEAEKMAIKSKETQKGLDEATTVLEGLIKPGSLLDQSTGSYIGSWADTIAGAAGYPLEGAKAAASIKILADPILKMVPRFEGPQSDKDTQTYKEAAGQLADETLPADVRRSAAKTLLLLFNRRKGQFVSADELANVQSGGTVSAAPSSGGFTPPPGWSHTVR